MADQEEQIGPEEIFYKELRALIQRYYDESDLSVCQFVGALDVVKWELIFSSSNASDLGKGFS